MLVTPGLGTLDEDGQWIDEHARVAAQALVRSMEIVREAAGTGD
jgi:hypothetical protein